MQNLEKQTLPVRITFYLELVKLNKVWRKGKNKLVFANWQWCFCNYADFCKIAFFVLKR